MVDQTSESLALPLALAKPSNRQTHTRSLTGKHLNFDKLLKKVQNNLADNGKSEHEIHNEIGNPLSKRVKSKNLVPEESLPPKVDIQNSSILQENLNPAATNSNAAYRQLGEKRFAQLAGFSSGIGLSQHESESSQNSIAGKQQIPALKQASQSRTTHHTNHQTVPSGHTKDEVSISALEFSHKETDKDASINGEFERNTNKSHISKMQTFVDIVKVETHFNFDSTVARYAGSKIISSLEAQIAPTQAIPTSTIDKAQSSQVRILHIQLQPENLGALKVILTLHGKELKLKIETSSKETAAILARDHQLLKDLVQAAGYEITDQSVAITVKNEFAPSLGFPHRNQSESAPIANAFQNGLSQSDQGGRDNDRRGPDANAERGHQSFISSAANETDSGEDAIALRSSGIYI